jgi:hypothetical protein
MITTSAQVFRFMPKADPLSVAIALITVPAPSAEAITISTSPF